MKNKDFTMRLNIDEAVKSLEKVTDALKEAGKALITVDFINEAPKQIVNNTVIKVNSKRQASNVFNFLTIVYGREISRKVSYMRGDWCYIGRVNGSNVWNLLDINHIKSEVPNANIISYRKFKKKVEKTF